MHCGIFFKRGIHRFYCLIWFEFKLYGNDLELVVPEDKLLDFSKKCFKVFINQIPYILTYATFEDPNFSLILWGYIIQELQILCVEIVGQDKV